MNNSIYQQRQQIHQQQQQQPLLLSHHQLGPSTSKINTATAMQHTVKSQHHQQQQQQQPEHHRKTTTNVGTVCMLGLSGSELEKGTVGVGKSTLCNRMVRPGFVDFSTEHISCLSQADFLCSPVINSDHWLYWGEVEMLTMPAATGTNNHSGAAAMSHRSSSSIHLHVIEQTVFLDDERFEPLGSAFRTGKLQEDYLRKAFSTRLESRGKIAYQNRDQLGQESDFIREELPNGGQISVDAFCVLFDVSFVQGRSTHHQAMVVSAQLIAALKSKKPVFLVGTKFDNPSPEGLMEWQRLLGRKELKPVAHNIHTIELSALANVNVVELLTAIAASLERQRPANRPHPQQRVLPYSEAERLHNRRIEQIRSDFYALLESTMPREEYLLQRNAISWSRLLADGMVSVHPAYMSYVQQFGPRAAQCAYEEHVRASKEWWFEHELSVRLPSLRDVLRRMFDRSFLCQAKWAQLVREIELHPEFDAYFQPLGRSLDRLSGIDDQHHQWDERLPSEMLQKRESQQLFNEFQRELLDEIALERQADKFRTLLAQKDAITPGRSFRDAKVMLEELDAFEQALPAGTALRIYEHHQEQITQHAQRDFLELLLEHIELFVDIIVAWRTQHPELPPLIHELIMDGDDNSAVHAILREDKRYRTLNGLPDLRTTAIGQFASFLSLPLERHCPAGALCADLGATILLQQHIPSTTRFYTIELAMHGSAHLKRQFLNAIRSHTGSAQVFAHNGLSVRFTPVQPAHFACPSPVSSPSLATRIPSQLYLFSTRDEAEQLLLMLSANNQNEQQQQVTMMQLISRPSVGGLCPLVVLLCSVDKLNDQQQGQMLQQIGHHLADQLGGIFKLLPYFSSASHHSSSPNSPSPPPTAPLIIGAGNINLGSSFESDDERHPQFVDFSVDHLEMLLHELCTLQLDSGHSDLHVRVSSMCCDAYSLESILSPLLDHTHLPIDHSGRKFWLDAHLPVDTVGNCLAASEACGAIAGSISSLASSECSPRKDVPSPTPSLIAHRLPHHRCKARVCISIGSYHHWLLAKWPLQSVQGHLLIFSPSRRASWRHARCAAQMLLDSVGSTTTMGDTHLVKADNEIDVEEGEIDEERRAMGRSIFLLAVSEPNAFFADKRVAHILTKAERFAQRIGAMFAAFGGGPNCKSSGAQTQCFLEFFQRILQNPFPPADYYTITSRHIIPARNGRHGLDDWHSIAQSRICCSTLTGSAETLLTEGSPTGRREDGADATEEGAEHTEILNDAQQLAMRRRSKQSRIALIGSPLPLPSRQQAAFFDTVDPQQQMQQQFKRRIPPSAVLRNDSQLSRCTALTQWTNASVLTASTLTGEPIMGGATTASRDGAPTTKSHQRLLRGNTIKTNASSAHGSDSTTRTPLASSGDEERKQKTNGGQPRQQRDHRALIGIASRNNSAGLVDGTTAIVGKENDKQPHDESKHAIPRMREKENGKSSNKRPQSALVMSPQLLQLPASTSMETTTTTVSSTSSSTGMGAFPFVDDVLPSGDVNAVNGNEQHAQLQQQPKMTSGGSGDAIDRNGRQNANNECNKTRQQQQQQQSNVAQSRRTPRKLEKLFSSFVQLRSCNSISGSAETDSNACPALVLPQQLSLPAPPQQQQQQASHRFPWLLRSPRSQSRDAASAVSRTSATGNDTQNSNGFTPSPNRSKPHDATSRSPSTTMSSSVSDGVSSKSTDSGVAGANSNSKQQQQPSSSTIRTLAELCAAAEISGAKHGLPTFLVDCVRTIEENGGLLTEGIYRVPGNQIDVERMFLQQPQRSGRKGRGTNASGATPAVASIDYANIPVHALATGLKRFLDTLPEPLIPERVHLAVLSTLDPLINSTINVIEITNEANGHRDEQTASSCSAFAAQQQLIGVLRHALPPENRRVLCFLIAHLGRVAAKAAENAMDLRNLAKVWSPTLFRPNFDSFEAMACHMARFERATLVLLTHGEQLQQQMMACSSSDI